MTNEVVSSFFLEKMLLFVLIYLAWVIPWKVVALWRAARNNHKVWFGFIFIVNSLAILEIIYIFGFSKKKLTGKK